MPKSASQLGATQAEMDKLVKQYNNYKISNPELVRKLDTTWSALMTKVRCNKTLAAQLKIDRKALGPNGKPVAEEESTTPAVAEALPSERHVSEQERASIKNITLVINGVEKSVSFSSDSELVDKVRIEQSRISWNKVTIKRNGIDVLPGEIHNGDTIVIERKLEGARI